MRVSEIRVNQIRVNQGLGVIQILQQGGPLSSLTKRPNSYLQVHIRHAKMLNFQLLPHSCDCKEAQ